MSRNPSERKTIKETQEVGQKTLPGLPSCGPGHCGDNGVMFHTLLFHLQFLPHSLLPFFNQRPLSPEMCRKSRSQPASYTGSKPAARSQLELGDWVQLAEGNHQAFYWVFWSGWVPFILSHVPLLLRLVFWTPGLQSPHSPQKSLREAGIYRYRLYTWIPGVPTASRLMGYFLIEGMSWVLTAVKSWRGSHLQDFSILLLL